MFPRRPEPDSYRIPVRLHCLAGRGHGLATNGLFCEPCDREILAAVRRATPTPAPADDEPPSR